MRVMLTGISLWAFVAAWRARKGLRDKRITGLTSIGKIGNGKKMQVIVRLNGGSKNGQWIKYTTPLPKILVITRVSNNNSTFNYENYKRREETNQYDFVYSGKGES